MIQGVVTGIGFLGAGVIIRNENGKRVRSLTTAACVSPPASVPPAGGSPAGSGLVAFAIFALDKPFERWVLTLTLMQRLIVPDKRLTSFKSFSSQLSRQ